MTKLFLAGLAIVLLCTGLYFYSCHNNDLRGWWRESDDEKTYLVVDDPDGSNCPPIYIDGRPVPAGIGEKFEIQPGGHSIICGIESDARQAIGFVVKPGVEYHVDYWGP